MHKSNKTNICVCVCAVQYVQVQLCEWQRVCKMENGGGGAPEVVLQR